MPLIYEGGLTVVTQYNVLQAALICIHLKVKQWISQSRVKPEQSVVIEVNAETELMIHAAQT